MAKVKCRVCSNEVSNICTIKKVGVKPNKPRVCDAFIYDKSKVKIHKEIPTIKYGYKERMEERRKRKEELKRLKAESKKDYTSLYEPMRTTNSKYPTTGDLSRFITSADKGE
jgi:hypothetical protein